MALTEFGKVVRKARIDTGQTLLSMAEELGTTASFLSAMETGRKKVSEQWVAKIAKFFEDRSVDLTGLDKLALVANESVPIDGLPLQQQMMIAGFAKSSYTPDELKAIAQLLEKINSRKKD
ncbi:helix-turn-helix domain-containing protein [Burkholderia stagnalis]|uniref:helix-turn-helix domain-containing protein n=1 Tax=Burkholderia stagnalis TaxID=1503054 RepID=UPI000F56E838|nr:helix-turn-helix transcriptional regulator [Burkholderia stagnalis]MDY7806446.1 helix-turn-helix transcriptional regulator [Burkholderia stagnalis]RQQ42005.1 XRE family transcriptional regulator [Burkholderia stagnalis]RQX87142.1 XRE family transcriptional regulator [Burkholderia stagnalis]RQY07230.1 XRE family transcriptional regulator [Burkholderia stagnalis]RQY22278.1 XRE family transcriptional regulator [Burkholderia stagnalis]